MASSSQPSLTPPGANTGLIVLFSSSSFDRQVASRQKTVFTILDSKGIVYELVDGADPSNKERRNELFAISGKRAQYPQFFLVDSTTTSKTVFWGDYETFENANEVGTLAEELGGAKTTDQVSDGLVESTVIQGGEIETHIAVVQDDDAEETKNAPVLERGIQADANEITTNALSDAAPVPAPAVVKDDEVAGTKEAISDVPVVKQDVRADSNEAAAEAPSDAAPAPAPAVVEEEQEEEGDGTPASRSTKETEESHDTLPIKTDITVYGATSFVAKHVLTYLLQVSLSLPRDLHVTLAGRNKSKLEALKNQYESKMNNLVIIHPKATAKCILDNEVVVAEGKDADALQQMTQQTNSLLNCAGPFAKYSSLVVGACAETGTDYVDITGEIGWAGQMRQQYGAAAAKSGARILSCCGFDSIPSDLAVYTAVEALRKASQHKSIEIATATTWHSVYGFANGGTIHTALDMPVELSRLFHPVPFLLEDPLILVHPKLRDDPSVQSTRNRLAFAEWWNQIPSLEPIFCLGVSIPFMMAPVNAKIVHASAMALKYGRNFVYRERYLPVGFAFTTRLSFLSLLPAMLTQLALFMAIAILKLPVVGKALANWLAPPGSGMSDDMCKAGYAEVYAEVTTEANQVGSVDKANCFVKLVGDPGNWVTAQCVSEAALALVFNKNELPARSEDGFGTPAELLGNVLLQRLKDTSVRRPVVKTHVRTSISKTEWRMYP